MNLRSHHFFQNTKEKLPRNPDNFLFVLTSNIHSETVCPIHSTHCLGMVYNVMDFTWNEYSAPRAIEKIKILLPVFELPAKQQCQFGLFTKKLGKMGWIGCAA